MDLLLGGFLDRRFPKLAPEQQAAFAVLAEMEDIELWPLVMGRRECPDPVQREVLVMLRQIGAPVGHILDDTRSPDASH
jgi:succinate dehydrogenase flavin-adding protein (antitoxin of CptAB toxin-antitoxin module)